MDTIQINLDVYENNGTTLVETAEGSKTIENWKKQRETVYEVYMDADFLLLFPKSEIMEVLQEQVSEQLDWEGFKYKVTGYRVEVNTASYLDSEKVKQALQQAFEV